MSFVARRLSGCLPQEGLVRRSSATAHDLPIQISQFDAVHLSPGAERNGSPLHPETPPPLLVAQNHCSSAGRKLSLDVTRFTSQLIHGDSQRGSLNLSPACRPKHSSPTAGIPLRSSIFQRTAPSSPEQFFGRAFCLGEEWDEGVLPVPSPTGHRNRSLHHQEFLSSCPSRQQRRQSWGPAVFSPSPVSSGQVHAGYSIHRQDYNRRQSLGPSVTSPSRCFQILLDAGSPSPSLAASPSPLSSHCTVIPLPIIPMKLSAVECAADAKRSGANRSSSISNIVPSIVTDSTEQEILNNTSLETRINCSHRGHSEELQPHLLEECRGAWGKKSQSGLAAYSQRRASWHTTLATNETWVSATRCRRRHNFGSARTTSSYLALPPRLHNARPGSILGKGGFGVVKLGRYRGRGVAVKVLKGRRAAASSAREAKVLPLVPHRQLAWTLAVVTNTAKGLARVSWAHALGKQEEVVSRQTVTAMFNLPLEDTQGCPSGEQQKGEGEEPWWAWVVSELCLPHTLLTLINDTSLTLTSEMRVRYILELSRGLAHLHAHGLAHRDLKPGNVLLTHSGHLKIADFGCCASLDLQDEDIVLGTVRYQAPEVLRGEVGGSHSDVFSLGVTTWHLLTRILPYQDLHPHIVIYQVAYLNHRPPDHHPHPCPNTFLDSVLWRLAHTCWSEEHSLRPTAASLVRNLTLLLLASSPRSVSGLPDIKVCHSDSPSPPATAPPPHPPSSPPSLLC